MNSLEQVPKIPLHMETRTMTEAENQKQTATQNQAIADYYNTAPIQFRAPPPNNPLYSESTRDIKKEVVIQPAPTEGFAGSIYSGEHSANLPNIQYAMINDTDFVALKGTPSELKPFSTILYTPTNMPESPMSPDDTRKKKSKPGKCSRGDDILFKFYMGSITVVGLYVLYRLL